MNKQEIMRYVVGKSLECKTVLFQHYTHGQFYRFGLNEHDKLFTINDNGDLEEWSAVKVKEYFAVNIPNIKRFVIEVESNIVYGVVYQPESGNAWLSQCHHETREDARQAGERILKEWPDMAYTIVKFIMENEQ